MSAFEARRRISMSGSDCSTSFDGGCQFMVRYGSISRTVVLQAQKVDTAATLKSMLASRLQAPGLARYLRLTFNGHDLPDELPIATAGVQDGSTLSAVCRARGGGGDGGSTGAESRSCYLEMYAGKKLDKVNPAEETLAKWTRCHLSGERLQQPCVCDELGNLYNKDSVVSALLHKTMPPELWYITSLRHLTNLQLAPTPRDASSTRSRSSEPTSFNEADFQCPVTGLELSGRFRFLVHQPTGHVVSEKAIKDVPAAVVDVVGRECGPDDWLPLNPVGEELIALRERVQQRVAADKAKKSSKSKKKQQQAVDGDEASPPKKRAGEAPAAAAPYNAAKKAKTLASMPAFATSAVYSSLFTSSETAPQKETFLCRNTGAHSRIN